MPQRAAAIHHAPIAPPPLEVFFPEGHVVPHGAHGQQPQLHRAELGEVVVPPVQLGDERQLDRRRSQAVGYGLRVLVAAGNGGERGKGREGLKTMHAT